MSGKNDAHGTSVGERDVAGETFEQYGIRRLTHLAHATGLGDETQKMLHVLRRMMSPWGSWKIGEKPHWHSDVCADGSPIEFSMAVDGGAPEVRVLVEALSPTPELKAMQGAARELTHTLVSELGASDVRLRQVEDLFLPAEPQGGYAMMHAVIFRPNQPNDFKVYLNPEARGEANSVELIREALGRLGFERAWPSVQAFARRGFRQDRLVYLSLDLAEHEAARVKIYFRHYALTARELDEAMAIARGHQAGYAESFCRDVSGHQGAFVSQPLVSCLSFTDPSDMRPDSATLYVPLWTYAQNDAVTRTRIRAALLSRTLPATVYERALETVAQRPLELANGIHTYASLRIHKGRPRITTYWSSELYDRNPPPRYQQSDPQESERSLSAHG
jgi:DMATS type aromatic prenyltransferase